MEEEKHIKYLFVTLIVLAALSLIDIPLFFILPQETLSLVGEETVTVWLIVGSLTAAAFFALCAWGIKKHNKIAYVATWLALILAILRLQIVGIILAVFMIVWLVKTKKVFFKKK